MTDLALQPVSFHVRGDDLHGNYVIRYSDGRNAFVTIEEKLHARRARGRGITVGAFTAFVSTNRTLRPRAHTLVKGASELGDVAIEARAKQPRTAYALPPGEVIHTRNWLAVVAIGASTFFVLCVLGQLVMSPRGVPLTGIYTVAALIALLTAFLVPTGRHHYKAAGSHSEIPLDSIVDPE